MPRPIPRRFPVLYPGPRGRIAAALVSATGLASAAPPVDGTVRVVSDYLYRSYSKSGDAPAPQLQVWRTLPAGAFLGLGVSRVELGDADIEFAPYAGFGWTATPDLRLIATVAGYLYEADLADRPGHYVEPSVALRLRDQGGLRIGWAVDLYGLGSSVPYAEANWRMPFSDVTSASLTAGYEHTAAITGDDYGYWNAGVTHYPTPRWALDVRYHGSAGVARRAASPQAAFLEPMEIGHRVVFSVSFGF